jgi:hypothetical protein
VCHAVADTRPIENARMLNTEVKTGFVIAEATLPAAA